MQSYKRKSWVQTLRSRLRKWSSSTQQTWPRPGSVQNSDVTDQEAIRRARHAEQLLRDPMLAECMQAIEIDLIEQMRDASLDKQDMHTRLITALQCTRAIERRLMQLLQHGHAAMQRIEMKGRRID